MGLLRRRRDEPPPTHHVQYRMQQDLISIGDDYWIEDSTGARAYRVNGKAIRFRDTWILETGDGDEVARIREKKLSIRDAITIDLDGRSAKVKKALVGIRDRFHVEVEHGEDLRAHGNIVDHEYEIERDGERIAEVSRRWFRVRDTYGVEVYDPPDTPLVLAVTVAIDALAQHRV